MSEVAVRFGPASNARSSPQRESQPVLQSVEIATVEVHTDPRAASAAWRELDAVAATSPYQSPEWLLPWIDTIGAASGVTPSIIVARGQDGSPLALLPFGLVRRNWFTVAVFLGARDSNFNMGLFRPGQTWTRSGVQDLLTRAAAASSHRVDAFVLINQPLGWDNVANPFAMLDHQPSPSFAYKGGLTSQADEFLRGRLSREGRKKLRQKLKKLQAIGPVSIRRATSPADIVETLDAFVEQRRARSRARGLLTDDLPVLRDFLNRVTDPHASPPRGGCAAPVAFYALRCGERVVATFGGTRRGRRFSGMLMSFAADPDFAKASPGELLLSEVLKLHCAEGSRDRRPRHRRSPLQGGLLPGRGIAVRLRPARDGTWTPLRHDGAPAALHQKSHQTIDVGVAAGATSTEVSAPAIRRPPGRRAGRSGRPRPGRRGSELVASLWRRRRAPTLNARGRDDPLGCRSLRLAR